MKGTYRPLRDPVFITALAVYALNRWVLEPAAAGRTAFFHSYVNDLCCIPFWMPLWAGVASWMRLRPRGQPPLPVEVAIVLPLWAVVFEGIGPALPALFPGAVADPWDLVAYAAGALPAMLVWRARASRE